MLTTSEIAAELAKVTYKPEWRFTCYDGVWEGQHIVITATLTDSYDPTKTTVVDVHDFLPPIPDAAYLHRWLMWRLGRIETHEMREFYRVEGHLVDDPHAPNAGRDNPDYRVNV